MSETAKPETNNVAQLPAKSSFRKLSECKNLQEAFETRELRDRIASALPEKVLTPERMLRAFVQAATRAPLIYKCDLRQAIGSFLSLSYLGLEPGTIQQHAHLIPFKTNRRVKLPNGQWESRPGYDLQVIIGYPGYVELAFRSGFVRDVATGIVIPGDRFDFERGSKRFLHHTPQIDSNTAHLTPRAGWAMAKFVNDGEEFEVMGWHEILAIRGRSQAYRRALAAKEEAESNGRRLPLTWTEAPWVRDERQMARKTALRRLATLLPKCPELRAGVGLDTASEEGKHLDYGPIIDGVATPMDGMPETTTDEEQDEAGPAASTDAGATHTDRRPTNGRTRSDTRSDTQRRGVDTSTSQQNPKGRTARQQPAREPEPPAFEEAILIDAYDKPVGEPLTSAVAFANAFAAQWDDTFPEDRDQLRTHNADAIADAERDPAAAKILSDLSDQGSDDGGTEASDEASDQSDEQGQGEGEEGVGQNVGRIYEAVRPIIERGKPQWQAWVRTVRDELATLVDPADVVEWTEAQRVVMKDAPMAQRALAIRAIIEVFGQQRREPPPWLSDLMSGEEDSPGDPDLKWVGNLENDLRALPKNPQGREHFQIMMDSTAAKTKMARLKQDRPELFKRAAKAFDDKRLEFEGR